MLYRHFFWDFDGTLFDTYGRITRASVNALEDLGAAASFDQVYPVVKRSLTTCYERFAAPLGISHETFLDAYHAHSESEGASSIRPYPGAKEALEAIVLSGGRNYLYTHRGGSAQQWMDHYGFTPLFCDQVTRWDPFPLKPAPDALNYLCEKHRLDKRECVMIGDRDIDLDAGKNAGMACALFDPENFYPDYDTPWRFKSMPALHAALIGQ
ncbi:MAG: HAD-IA family hydrolase [Clostridia bacterium]|nr:HAD-IA family hydrolase [Clostridia bacterium]